MHAVSVLAAATIHAGSAGRQSDAQIAQRSPRAVQVNLRAAQNRPANSSSELQSSQMFRFQIRVADKGAPAGKSFRTVRFAHLEHRLW